MKFLNYLSMMKKIVGLSAILLLFLIGTAAISLTTMHKIGEELTSIAKLDMPLTELITKITEHQFQQTIFFERAMLAGVLADTVALDTNKVRIEEVGQKVEQELKTAESMIKKAQQTAHEAYEKEEFNKVYNALTLIDSHHSDFEKHIHEAISAIQDDDLIEAKQLGHIVETEADNLNKELTSLLAEIEGFTHEATERALEHEQQAFVLTAVIAVVALVFGVLISVSMAASMSARLKRSVTALETVASGDLTGEIVHVGVDEIAVMRASMEKTRQSLHSIIQKISVTSNQLSVTSEEVATAMTEGSKNILGQQTETEALAASVHQLNATANEISRNIAEVFASVESADQDLQVSNQIMDTTMSGISRLTEELDTSSHTVKALDETAGNINTVLVVISTIAEQTNLLALNAAIEAARAGDKGRGFAVVADEVRNLASRTQASTTEIQGIIEQLQQGTRSAVDVIEKTKSEAEQMAITAEQSSASLNSVAQQMKHVTDMASQIAAASDEQSQVTEGVSKNVELVSDLSAQNAATIEETSQSGYQLALVAEELNTSISSFKL